MQAVKPRLLIASASNGLTPELLKTFQGNFEVMHGSVSEYLSKESPDQGQDQRDDPELVLFEANHLRDVLRRLSWVETSTGIPNRKYLDEMLNSEWRRNARNRTAMSMVLMEPDHFQSYRQAVGNKVAEEVQQRIVMALSGGIQRAGDVVGRFEGDAIACLLPETDMVGAVSVAERVRATIHAMDLNNAKGEPIALSLGVASLVPSRSDTLKDFLQLATNALRRAQERGGNQVVFS